MLCDPGLRRAGHSDEQKSAVRGERRDGDLYQPPIPDILRRDDVPVLQRGSKQVVGGGPGGELPVRRFRPRVGLRQLVQILCELLFGMLTLHLMRFAV